MSPPSNQSDPENEDTVAEPRVTGERGLPPLQPFRSVQSRVSGLLTSGLMIALAAGLLVYYYSHAMNRGAQARSEAQSRQNKKAQGESVLPPYLPFTLRRRSPVMGTPVKRSVPATPLPQPKNPICLWNEPWVRHPHHHQSLWAFLLRKRTHIRQSPARQRQPQNPLHNSQRNVGCLAPLSCERRRTLPRHRTEPAT